MLGDGGEDVDGQAVASGRSAATSAPPSGRLATRTTLRASGRAWRCPAWRGDGGKSLLQHGAVILAPTLNLSVLGEPLAAPSDEEGGHGPTLRTKPSSARDPASPRRPVSTSAASSSVTAPSRRTGSAAIAVISVSASGFESCGPLVGYEDVSDAARLARGPAMRTIVGRREGM